jgi:hypothetical protein
VTTKPRAEVLRVDTDAALGAFVAEQYDRLLRVRVLTRGLFSRQQQTAGTPR